MSVMQWLAVNRWLSVLAVAAWVALSHASSAVAISGVLRPQEDLNLARQASGQALTKIDQGTDVTGVLFRVILVAAVILFVVLILVGGVQYLGSFGNEEATTKAKKLIIDSVVGLFIVLAAFGIASFIFGQFGVNLGGNITNYLKTDR